MGDDSQPLVRAVDMGKRYGEFVALHPLNVEVHSGEFFGVFGPNGAGKSTFIKLLTGQLQPSIGHPHLFTNLNFSFWMNRLQILTLFISENAENGCSITSMVVGQSSSAHTFLRWQSECATAWPLSIMVVFWLQERYQE